MSEETFNDLQSLFRRASEQARRMEELERRVEAAEAELREMQLEARRREMIELRDMCGPVVRTVEIFSDEPEAAGRPHK